MISERVYRALLMAYPSDHRRQYGEPMVQLFRDRMRRSDGGFRTLDVWLHMIFDLVCAAFKERKEGAMLDSAMVKRSVVRSAELLFWSLVGATVLYIHTTSAVLITGLVSFGTGWYPFVIESGPLGFLGYTMHVDNRNSFYASFEFSLIGFLALILGVALLIRIGSAVRALRTSLGT